MVVERIIVRIAKRRIKMLIGITGVIGSGKSFIGQLLKEKNYLVYDSDEFVLKAYQDEKILLALQKVFFNNAPFDKAKLKELLYNQPSNLQKLNQIIHPFVICQIQEIKKKYENDLVFVEIPLLFECHLESLCDYTITVKTSKCLQKKRLKTRNLQQFHFMQFLQKQQLSQKEKIRRADFIIENKMNLKKTKKSLQSFVDNLKKIN